MKPFLLLLLLFITCPLLSQQLTVLTTDTSNYPNIKAKLFLLDQNGQSKGIQNRNEIEVTENGSKRQVLSLKCTPAPPPTSISSVLVVDISGSMKNKGNMSIAKRSALLWVNSLRLGPSECGVVSFDHSTYSNQGLTVSKELLYTAINTLRPIGGTDYNAALLNPNAGIAMVSKGRNKKVIVMLTDGLGGADTEKIIQKTKAENVVIYVVTLRINTPSNLKEIATETGGKYFSNINNEQEAAAAYMTILSEVSGLQTCEIEWRSEAECGSRQRNVNIQIPSLSLQDSTRYYPTEESIQKVVVVPQYINFGNREVGKTFDTTITITAIRGRSTITDIIGENEDFEFDPNNLTIEEGRTAKIKVRYKPKSTTQTWGSYTVVNSLCPIAITLVGGTAVKKDDSLIVVSPNGGETFRIAYDTIIRWSGISPNEKVMIEFSNDGGNTWELLTNSATGGEFKWKKVSGPKSTNCLIRISRHSDKNERRSWIYNNNKDWVTEVSWSPDGSQVASAGFDSHIYLHNAYSGELDLQLVGHYSPLWDLDWSPKGDKLASVGSDGTVRIWDTRTGKELKKYENFTCINNLDEVEATATSWHPSQNVVVIGTLEFCTLFLNLDDGTIRKLKIPINSGLYQFSPDGKYFYFAHKDDADNKRYVLVYDFETLSLVSTIDNGFNTLASISWREDNTLRINSRMSTNFIYTVFDPLTGVIIRTWTLQGYHQTGIVSPDEKYIAYVGPPTWVQGYISFVKEIETEKIVFQSPVSLESTFVIEWSKDSKVVAFGCWDFLVKLFSLEQTSLQEDISDTTFTVNNTEIANVSNVNLGEILVNTQIDTMVSRILWSNSSLPTRIDTIWYEGSTNIKMMHNHKFPLFLGLNDSISIEFRFQPTFEGSYGGRVFFKSNEKLYYTGGYMNNNTTFINVNGVGIRERMQIETKSIDFGTIELGTVKDVLDEYVLYNNSSRSLTLTGIQLEDPNKESFEILTTGFPITLPLFAEYRMDVRYKPVRSGPVTSRLKFIADDPSSPVYIMLTGNATSPGEVLLYTEHHQGKAGTKHEVPIKIAGRVMDQALFQETISMDLGYNPSTLLPIGTTGLYYDDTTSLIGKNPLAFRTGTISTQNFTAGLGNRETSPLNLFSIKMPEGIEYYTDFGTFTLLGLCKEGGTRLLNVEPTVGNFGLVVTIHGNQIEIVAETRERGKFDIEFYSLQGQKLHTSSQTINEEQYIISNVDITNFATGSYFIVAKSATMQKTYQINIIR